ncbi:MAG: division/cell wall cluster transcriptional repressor MraZ [Actinomycetota bacterium]
MLLGEFRHSLDTKGRVFLPARWREELGESVVITLGLDRCLYLMAKPAFSELAGRLDGLALEDPAARAYVRVLFAKASEESVDGQGRISIPAHLREVAGLGRELVLAGASRRAEIWDRSVFDTYQGEAQERYEEIAKTLLRGLGA